MSYSRGARPSTPEKLAKARPADTHPDVASGATAAGRPVAFLPPRQDQDGTEECSCHAASQGLYASSAARGRPLGFVPSQGAMYANSGGIERALATLPGNTLPAMTEYATQGRQLADVLTAIASMGVRPMRANLGGRNSDASTDNAGDEPTLADLEKADPEKLSGAYRVDMQAPNANATCKAALDAGICLYLGFDCGQTFEGLGPNDVAQPTSPNDPGQGGHAVIVVDQRTNAAGEDEWLVCNSWGQNWAADGMVWASTAWVKAAWEVWLLDESLIATGQVQ